MVGSGDVEGQGGGRRQEPPSAPAAAARGSARGEGGSRETGHWGSVGRPGRCQGEGHGRAWVPGCHTHAQPPGEGHSARAGAGPRPGSGRRAGAAVGAAAGSGRGGLGEGSGRREGASGAPHGRGADHAHTRRSAREGRRTGAHPTSRGPVTPTQIRHLSMIRTIQPLDEERPTRGLPWVNSGRPVAVRRGRQPLRLSETQCIRAWSSDLSSISHYSMVPRNRAAALSRDRILSPHGYFARTHNHLMALYEHFSPVEGRGCRSPISGSSK